ncbi:hydroxysteroid dehydrogenase-like protein 2 [Oryzias latipes]|uniref:hydroxysteroid dehydrogenase-like protein 2 n=1 Tax=Oryzias latipes TaxID=8090 RepID=UPI000CE27230|nr:hydroxysteroid dehydrogenase-like protein 2 [Oryzias latipes]
MSAVLPQHLVTEEKDFYNQQRKFSVEPEEQEPHHYKEKPEEPEPPHYKEEQGEQEPPQIEEEQGVPELSPIKEEQEELLISPDEDQLDLKQETDTLMEIPTYEEDENSEADLNNQQSFLNL